MNARHWALVLVVALPVAFIGGRLTKATPPPVARERAVEKRSDVAVEKAHEARVADVAVKRDTVVTTRWLPSPLCTGELIVERTEQDRGTTDTHETVAKATEAKRETTTETVTVRELATVQPRWSLGAGPSWNALQLRPTGATATVGVRVVGRWWLKANAGAGDGLRAGLMIERAW